MMTHTSGIALLTMFLAIGIAVGALFAARLIPLAYLRRARLAAYGLGVAALALSFVDTIWGARVIAEAVPPNGE